jgi:hypothetical protein
VANSFISNFNTNKLHIKSPYTQQHCYVSIKTLHPGWMQAFLFLRRMQCPLRHAGRATEIFFVKKIWTNLNTKLIAEIHYTILDDFKAPYQPPNPPPKNEHRGTSLLISPFKFNPKNTAVTDSFNRPQCADCGKAFKKPDALYYHRKAHHEKVRHTCPECEKSFTR